MPARRQTGDDEVDALFRLPPSEFTAARNALAASLKKRGHPDRAAAVKALDRPSLSAWAVNQLYWSDRAKLSQLLESGDRFRDAQRAQLAGKQVDLKTPLESRRAALTAAVKDAAEILRKAGHEPSPDVMRRISTTLDALATHGSPENGPPAGRLTDDLQAPGFEALATLVPRGRSSSSDHQSRVIPFAATKTHKAQPAVRARHSAREDRQRRERERAAREAAARKALKEATEALRHAREVACRAEAELKRAAARAKAAERQRAEAEAQFEKESKKADEATRQARDVARHAEEAAQAVTEAEADVERTRKALAQLE